MKSNVTIMHFRVGFLYNGYIYLYMCCYEERDKKHFTPEMVITVM